MTLNDGTDFDAKLTLADCVLLITVDVVTWTGTVLNILALDITVLCDTAVIILDLLGSLTVDVIVDLVTTVVVGLIGSVDLTIIVSVSIIVGMILVVSVVVKQSVLAAKIRIILILMTYHILTYIVQRLFLDKFLLLLSFEQY